MAANEIKCFRLEQRSVIKCLVAEKCKPCETDRRTCHEFRNACFSQKSLTSFLNKALPQ